MRQIRLAALVTAAGNDYHATHVPTVVEDGEPLVLTAHLARANPHWRALEGGVPSLAIFQGPHAYVSPSWYASKSEHGKVVPTWNYISVHAHGTLTAVDDPAWLRDQVHALTEAEEAGRSQPWAVADAPEDYVAGLTRAIVGVRFVVERLVGSWKLIQHKPVADRAGVVAGLGAESRGDSHAIAEAMRASEASRA
jgi:transcriptional regulator